MKGEFIKALENNDLRTMQKISKSDLHSHGARGGNITYIEDCYNVKIPRLTSKFDNLSEMQQWYEENVKSICVGKLGYENRIKGAFEQAKNDGVKILSMSVGYSESNAYDNSQEKWIEALKTMHQSIAPEVIFLPELSFNRGVPVEVAIDELECLAEYNYFKSIDLHGNEFAAPIIDYKKLYRKAKEKGMILKAHAGEFGDAESVKEAVEELELDEVQHGIAAASSKSVMRFLSDNNVQLNVCPTSNVLLKRVKNYKEHPIKTLFHNGVKVTLNTDDMIIFNQSVSDEFFNLYNAGLFNGTELNQIRENGLEKLNAIS